MRMPMNRVTQAAKFEARTGPSQWRNRKPALSKPNSRALLRAGGLGSAPGITPHKARIFASFCKKKRFLFFFKKRTKIFKTKTPPTPPDRPGQRGGLFDARSYSAAWSSRRPLPPTLSLISAPVA
jgi:hypothetical protein